MKIFSFIFHAIEVWNLESKSLFPNAFALNVILSVKNYVQNKVSVSKPCRSCRKIKVFFFFSETNLALISGKFCQKFRGNRKIWIVMMPEIQICKKEV